MNVYEKYIEQVEAINAAKTQHEHDWRSHWLDGWLRGFEAAGEHIGRLIIAGDRHYLDQGIDRPMCGGVFLDWKPSPASKGRMPLKRSTDQMNKP